LKFYKLGIICGILHQEYLKMSVKKVNNLKDIKLEIFNSIETFFFDLQKFDISFMPYNVAWFFKNNVLSGRIRHFKK